MRLDQVSEGKRFRVKRFLENTRGIRRIHEMGISESQECVLLRNKRGPLLVATAGRQIAIGRGIASQVEVEIIETFFYRQLALIGQPNCGKTLVFNRLTGSSQHVGNWPGVTVERKEGKILLRGVSLAIVDLPGIYSFSSLSEEEEVAKSFVLNAKETLFVNILDATHLEANLYLTIQLSLMRVPMVVVVNMMDEAEQQGLAIDLKRLEELLGVPVIGISALSSADIARLKSFLSGIIEKELSPSLRLAGDTVSSAIEKVAEVMIVQKNVKNPFWEAYHFLETGTLPEGLGEREQALLENIRTKLRQTQKQDFREIMVEWILSLCMGMAREVVQKKLISFQLKKKITAFLDAVFLNTYVGLFLFFFVMGGVFWVTFQIGGLLSGYLEQFFAFLGGLAAKIPSPVLASFVSDGLIGGVGNVLTLLPYIVVMFFLLSFLEDSGYLARGTFLLDRFMHKLGLHGKSFVPMVLGFGCSVPALMSTRILDHPGDRLKTMMIIPFFSCSARMPVFALFAAAFFGRQGWIAVFSLYLLGVAMAIFTAWWLSKTVIREHSEGLIMELPVYRFPALINLWNNTWLRSKGYLVRAGTILVVFSLFLWGLSVLPWGVEPGSADSLIGRIGKGISWVFLPLGFDWQMVVALINGFFAKEIVISTLGVLYGRGRIWLGHFWII